MKAAFLNPDGAPSLRELDEPEAAAGEVVVRVERIALHHGNLLGAGERALGSEGVGTVEAVGAGVQLATGTRVGVFPAWGAAREKIVVPAEFAFPLDSEVDADVAAQLFVNPLTAQLVLRELGASAAAAGATAAAPVIVTGAASVLGRTIVVGALARGHRVVATTRRASSAAALTADLGIPAIATQGAGWLGELRAALGADAPVAVLDGAGGPDVAAYFELLPAFGALIEWGDLSGEPFTLTTSGFLPLQRVIRGVSVLHWAAQDPEVRAADIRDAQRLAVAHPELFPVAQRYRLDELGQAVARVREARGDGVVLVAVAP